ncbi:MAG TPA: hypothetical protein VM488_02245 [Pseudobacter sp.]|nr:hypothetical protein [Pseudobacter sp.]
MSFITDKQTLDDLNLLGKYKGNSIFNLFDHTSTRGGAKILEDMFQHPLTDAEAINQRTALLKFFQAGAFSFPVSKELCEEVEQYLSSAGASGIAATTWMMLRHKAMRLIAADQQYERCRQGILSAISLIRQVKDFMEMAGRQPDATVFGQSLHAIRRICGSAPILKLLQQAPGADMGFVRQVQYDHLLRHTGRQDLEELLHILYEVDVYIAVSRAAAARNFGYATALPFREHANGISMKNVAHPQLPGAVANSVSIDSDRNLVFLTGANMAGKSTFMKSCGIAIYLAHMGFPVAVEEMIFSVQDGIYTSINVPDNLDMGYSHFYAEVLRVKKVAEEVSRGRNLVIIFDELFKGTNVKDAYDATVAVTEAFGENRNCHFIVSTHIVEAGQTLQERSSNMQFLYFPTIMERQTPRYTYRLEAGISADRHGMMIIRNEGIVEIIKGKKTDLPILS